MSMPSWINSGPGHYVPSTLYPDESECWVCGAMVPGDITVAMRRCSNGHEEVGWKVEFVADPDEAARLLGKFKASQQALADAQRRINEALAERAQGA